MRPAFWDHERSEGYLLFKYSSAVRRMGGMKMVKMCVKCGFCSMIGFSVVISLQMLVMLHVSCAYINKFL